MLSLQQSCRLLDV